MFKIPNMEDKALNLEDIENLFNETYFKKLMESNIAHVLCMTGKKVSFSLSYNNSDIYTDGEKIVVGIPKGCVGMTYGEIYSIIKASVGHESAHVRWSNINMLESFLKEVSKRGINERVAAYIFNIIEDGRIERLLCKEFPGYIKYIQFFNLSLIKGSGNVDENIDVLSKILYVILYLSVLGTYPLNYEAILDEKDRKLIDSKIYPLILRGVITNSLVVHKNACLKILDLLKEYIPKDDESSLELELFELSEENYCSSEGKSVKDENLDSKVKSMFSDVNSDNLGSIVPNYAYSNEDNSLFMSNNDLNALKNDLKTEIDKEVERVFDRALKSNIEPINNNLDSYCDDLDLDLINSNYSSERQELNFEFIYPNYPLLRHQSEFDMKVHAIRKVFNNILKNKESYSKNQKRGRLDSSRLWRLAINDSSIFERKTVVDLKEYAIEILIDTSGSMKEGVKYKNAISTAICIESALTNIDGVEVKTVAFNYNNGTRMRVLKDFNDVKSKTPHLYNYDISGGQNRDGFAIRVALNDLKRHKAKNKMLIVISDGMPSCELESKKDSIADVKNAVHEGRKIATITGILISNGKVSDEMRNLFKYMYEEKGSIIVDVSNNYKDLMNNIILYLKRKFRK